MFAFIRAVTYTKPLDMRQCAHQLRSFSVSFPLNRTLNKDPTIRRQQMDEYNAWHKEKYAQDSEFREKRIQNHRRVSQARSDFEKLTVRKMDAFSKWVTHGLKTGARRACPSHTPEYSLAKETRLCTECGYYRNKRIWWKRNSASDSYDVRMTAAAVHRAHHQHLFQPVPT